MLGLTVRILILGKDNRIKIQNPKKVSLSEELTFYCRVNISIFLTVKFHAIIADVVSIRNQIFLFRLGKTVNFRWKNELFVEWNNAYQHRQKYKFTVREQNSPQMSPTNLAYKHCQMVSYLHL